MTPFGALLAACGLSHREAADHFGVAPDTIGKWCAGRRAAPADLVSELLALEASAALSARETAAMILGAEGAVEIGYPVDDEEAMDLGYPARGPWRAMAGRMLARLAAEGFDLSRIRFVPRGTPPATAAAIEARRERS